MLIALSKKGFTKGYDKGYVKGCKGKCYDGKGAHDNKGKGQGHGKGVPSAYDKCKGGGDQADKGKGNGGDQRDKGNGNDQENKGKGNGKAAIAAGGKAAGKSKPAFLAIEDELKPPKR